MFVRGTFRPSWYHSVSWANLRECRRDKKFSLANVSSNKRNTNLMCARGYRLATLHFLAGIFTCLLYSSKAAAETDPRRLYSAEPRHFYRRRNVSVMSAINERVERTASSPLVSEVSLRDHPLFACFIILYTCYIYIYVTLSTWISLLSPLAHISLCLFFSLRFAPVFNEC